MEKREAAIEKIRDRVGFGHLQNLHSVHTKMFIHEDNFILQMATQFLTLTAILLAFYGALMGFLIEFSSEIFLLHLAGLIVPGLGVLWTYLWFCSYKRSELYRNVHREMLLRLESLMGELRGIERFGVDVDGPEGLFCLNGGFIGRDRVLYDERVLKGTVANKNLKVSHFSRKKFFTNIESIPFACMIIWVICILVSVDVSYSVLFS